MVSQLICLLCLTSSVSLTGFYTDENELSASKKHYPLQHISMAKTIQTNHKLQKKEIVVGLKFFVVLFSMLLSLS